MKANFKASLVFILFVFGGAFKPVAAATIDLHLTYSSELNSDFSDFSDVKITFFGLDDEVTTQQSVTSFSFIGSVDNYVNVPASTAVENLFTFTPDGLEIAFYAPEVNANGENLGAVLEFLQCSKSAAFSTACTSFEGGDQTVMISGIYEILPTVPLPPTFLLLLCTFAGFFGLRLRWKM